MRSWANALKVLERNYPDMRGVITVNASHVKISLSRWLTGGKRAAIVHAVSVDQVDSSFIDIVLLEIAKAAAELQAYPYNHVVKNFEVVGGRDYEQQVRSVLGDGGEPLPK